MEKEVEEKVEENKADRHKSRAPSLQRQTDQPSDRLTDQQSGLQSCVHATKKQIETFEICFIFHFLIDINKDASFFLAIQKPYDKDFLKNKTTKKGNSLNREYQHILKESKLITGVVQKTTSLSYMPILSKSFQLLQKPKYFDFFGVNSRESPCSLSSR